MLLGALSASASITFDATSNSGTVSNTGASPASWNHTLGTGANRLVVCEVAIANNTAVASQHPVITFGGVTMTELTGSLGSSATFSSGTSKFQSELFYLNDTGLGSMSGSLAVVVTLPSPPAAGGTIVACTSFFGVAQAAPETTGGYSNTSGSQPATLTLSAASAGDLIVDGLAGGFSLNSTGKSASPTAGQTVSFNNQITADGILGASSYLLAPASGANTISWSDNTSRIGYSGAVFAAAAAAPQPCVLTINTSGTGTVSLSPTATNNSYTCGTQVTVTATPGNGYSFGSYSGAITGTTNPQTFTLNASSTITATFVQGSVCTLSTSVTSGSGTINVSPTGSSFTCGTQITVTAVPAQYYSLSGFSGAITGTTNPQTFTLNANSTIGASFTQTTFPVNVTIVGPGTVAASPMDSGNGYAPGTQVQLTATPNSGAFFSGFSGGLTGTTNPQTVTVNATVNVTATFTSPTITKDAVSHGSTTGSASTLTWNHTLGSGTSRALIITVGEADSTTASPDANATVTSVTYNGVYATAVPGSVVYGGTSGMVQSQMFYLLDSELPASGTYPVVVTLTGAVGGISAGAVSLIGVSQGPPEAVVTNKVTTGANTISTSITTLSNNDWVVDILEDGDLATLTANSGQTIAWQAEASVGTGGSSTDTVATASAVSLGWSGNANRLVQSLAAFPPATSTVPPTYTLTTSTAGGTGTVTANPNLSAYPTGTGVQLTASAGVGYAFASWSGDYTSTANPLPIIMSANRNIVANFTSAATCTFNLTIVGSGTVTPASGTYNCGTVLQLVATPGSGYSFTGYSGDFSSTDNPAYFTLNSNANVTAEFDALPTCALNVTTVGQGTVTPANGNYACGSVLTVQATAGSGYAFSGFTGDLSSTANPLTVTLNQSTNLTATFAQGSGCALTTSITGQGTITPSSGTWSCGTTIAIQADAASHYLFNGWGGALSGTTTPTTLALTANESVSATFVVNTAGVTGDTRTVTEPVYPPVCTVLTAVQTAGSLVETSPDTTRVQAALNACPSGKAVEFSANGSANAFIIQPITLPAGVTMLVDPEVTIFGSITYADYACSTSANWCNPLINIAPNAYPSPGSAIMGLGVIDGRGGVTLTDKGESWWKTGQDARPRLVYLSSHTTGASSDNFTAYQITLKNSPKFHLSGVGNDWTVWGIKVYAPPDSPNTDGVDPSGSSNVTITQSYISDGDDWVSPKADSGHIANVTVSNLHTFSGHGISIGSETNAGLNNMYVHDIVIDNGFGGTSFDSLRIKSGASEGGEVYDVLYKNICINNGGDTIVIDPYYTSASGTLYPNFHDITFSNVTKLLHNSSYKSTMTGYNTNGVVFPLTVTLDNVTFTGDSQNDFKAPDNFNNVQFTFGPGPVSMASYLQVDANTPSNLISITNSITNPGEAAYSCPASTFVYLVGDITAHGSTPAAHTATVTAGSSPTIVTVLQNVVSPVQAGTITYTQQNLPTGTVQLLEGTTVVGSATLNGRIANITVPSVTAGTHVYTANYLGDTHYTSGLAFGSFTLIALNPAPVANAQSVSVAYNTATPITLSATGSGTLTYTVLTNPTNGVLTGTAPNLIYTPNNGYSGADSFTFKANNGTDSNVATVSITVAAGTGGTTAQAITFPQPTSPANAGTSAMLNATANSGLAVTYAITSGPATLSGSTVTYNGTGNVVITATQAGNATYAPAAPVSRTVAVQGIAAIWLVDSNAKVSGLSSGGAYVTTAGTAGANSTLGGIAIDSTGSLWSVTSANNVLSFTTAGVTSATTFAGGGLNAPAAIAVDGAGMIWIANSGSNTVSVFTNAGVAVSSPGYSAAASQSSAQGLPDAIAIDNSGGVWVTNRTGNSVTHILGAATPVTVPLSKAVSTGTLGTAP